MTTATPQSSEINAVTATSRRANALAERLEEGASALLAVAAGLTETEWHSRTPGDGRKMGHPSYEVYLNNPMTTEKSELLTEIYLRLE